MICYKELYYATKTFARLRENSEAFQKMMEEVKMKEKLQQE